MGGTWYWNRYPGARFDSESYTYGYSFSEELLQEWDWTEHYAGQPETERYLNYVADKFDLRRDIQCNARVAAAVYDERTHRWQIHLEDGRRARAQFVITAVGLLSAQYIPDFAGLESFQGTWCHTGRWPAQGLDLTGKRVGVIGTGATGVQLITAIAKDVAHLTVFQRTANYCAPLRNGPIDSETQRQIKASYPDIFKQCSETAGSFVHQFDPRSAMAVSPEERLEQYERLWAAPGFKKWLANFHDIMLPGPANEDYAAFVRQKIRERVKDPVVAEKLVPKDHMFGSKRLPCESGYYEVYNQDNVVLVDVREAPIERITPTGVKTRDAEYALDVLIFATGYDAVTGPLNRIEIRGEGGQTLQDKFAAGPRTYMGLQSAGFPNLFTINAASVGNFVRAAEPLVDWVSDCICYVRDHQLTRIAPTPEREVKGNKALPTQTVRWVRWRTGRACWELLTNGIVPAPWSVLEALSPWRWQVERVFCDRTEGVNLPRFSPSSPNGVALQVYAAALVHTAVRVAQGHLAQASGSAPAEIAPAQVFPRLAAASIGLTWSELALREMQQAHPGIALSKPAWRRCDFAWTTLERMQVEPRNGRRRKRRFCQGRQQWKSFPHIPGGKN